MSNIQVLAVPNDTIIFSIGKNETPIVLELKETRIAENSVNFIRTANPGNFADLITIFTNAIVELTKAAGILKTALVKLEHKLEYMHADLLINHLPILAAQRGIKLTGAIAEDMIKLDADYSQALLNTEELKNNIEGLEAKHKAINTAYFAIKAVADMKFGGGYKPDYDLGIPENASAGTVVRRTNKFTGEF